MPANTIEPEKRLRSSTPYSSKIIKAGALIGDTKTLLSHWDVKDSADGNINRVRRDNVFGKASRSRVEDILAIFRQRYLTEQSVTKALVTLVQKRFPTAALEWLFYFHSARADRLLYDVVTEILGPLHARGLVDINVHAFQRSLAKWVNEGKTTGHWSEPTITAQFIRNTEEGWKLQTAQEKNWETERRGHLEPKPRDRNELARNALQQIFDEPEFKTFRFQNRSFRIAISVD